MTRLVSRRGVLLGAAGATSTALLAAGAVHEGVLPGRTLAYDHLGLNGRDGDVPDVRTGRTYSGSFVSQARLGTTCGWTIALPPGAKPGLPVVVVLHGRRGDHASAFRQSYLALDRYLAAAVEHGARPFALASVDGWGHLLAPSTKWRGRRRDGRGRVPAAASTRGAGHRPVRAARLVDGRVRRAAARWTARAEPGGGRGRGQPALWHTYHDTAPGAFDDAADFAHNTLFGHQTSLAGTPVRIDCGTGDPFYRATRDCVAGFAHRPAGGFERGVHEAGYWRRIAPRQLSFLSTALG